MKFLTKSILATAIACCFSATVLADNSVAGGFVGVGTGYDFHNKMKTDTGGSAKKDNNANISINGGYDFGNWRAYGEYTYNANAKDTEENDLGYAKEKEVYKWNSHDITFNADWTPQVADNFRLVVGAYTGYSFGHVKADYSKEYYSGGSYHGESKDDLTGWLLGARVGGIYDLDKNSSIDFGVKFDHTWYKDIDWSEYTYTTDFDRNKFGAYVGYKFKFN
ncbi:MAG: outer membrane beta-barrel protein [Cardiobacteriaceae bacterium]|nr:outer membrane beta-barrel protein [Cardiobacteriaceae bacterium]